MYQKHHPTRLEFHYRFRDWRRQYDFCGATALLIFAPVFLLMLYTTYLDIYLYLEMPEAEATRAVKSLKTNAQSNEIETPPNQPLGSNRR